MKLTKVIILVHNFSNGGAEKNYINFANFLNKKKYELRFISINNKGFSNNELDEKISLRNCKKNKFIFSIFKIIKFINEFKPDYIFTSLPHLNIGILILKKFNLIRCKNIIIREANVIDPKYQDGYLKNYIFVILKRIFYKNALKVIAITKAVQNNLIDFQKVNINNCVMIYNPFLKKKINEEDEKKYNWVFNNDHKVILAVGRLVKQKDFKNLIYSFSMLTQIKKKKLILIGEGPERKKLYNLSKKLNLLNNIHFIEKTNNINYFIRKSSVLVCSSLWEGTPNILVEGLKMQIPIVSTDFLSAYELLSDSLVYKIAKRNDPNDLSKKIFEILSNENKVNTNNKWKEFTNSNFSIYENLMTGNVDEHKP